MVPENVGLLLENAREVHAQLHDCVKGLGRLREMVMVVISYFFSVFFFLYASCRSR